MKTKKLIMVAISTMCLFNISAGAKLLNKSYSITHRSAIQPVIIPSVNTANTSFQNLSKPSASGNWVLCYESDKIYIYERWIKKNTYDSIRERKGVMIVNCDVAKAIKLITDYDNQKNWMKNVEEHKLIKIKSDTNWITYTLFSLPWPLDNRDVVSEYHLKVLSPNSWVQVKINSLKNLIKETEGIARINNYNATWFVKKVNDSNVAISFCASSDPQNSIPSYVLDPVMRKMFQKNLLNLKNILE